MQNSRLRLLTRFPRRARVRGRFKSLTAQRCQAKLSELLTSGHTFLTEIGVFLMFAEKDVPPRTGRSQRSRTREKCQ